MKKKTTEEAKKFWALAEETSKSVQEWPDWKRRFAAGYEVSEQPTAHTAPKAEDTQHKS